MPAKRQWSEDDTQLLRTLTAEGVSSSQIAERLGVSPGYIRNQRQRFNIRLPYRLAHRNAYPKPPAPTVTPDLERIEPLPAGHPATWGAMNRGTCLEGAPYGR